MEDHKEYSQKVKDVATQVGDSLLQSANVIKESAKTVIVTALDQTGSGTLGQEDLKILTEKGKVLAGKAAEEAVIIVKEAKKSNLFKEAAAGGIVGAVIAIPIPFVGPLMGAAIGGAIGLYVHVVRNGNK